MHTLIIGSSTLSAEAKARIPLIEPSPCQWVSIPGWPDNPAAPEPLQTIEPSDADDGFAPLKPQEGAVPCLVVTEAIAMLHPPQWHYVLSESFRLLEREGTAWFEWLLSDETIAPHMPLLIDGRPVNHIPQESAALAMLAEAGFHGLSIVFREEEPEASIAGAEIYRYLLCAYRGKQGPCFDFGHAVIYTGPWQSVCDDDGHRYLRGERTAVCKKTYDLLMRAPYAGQFIGLPPLFMLSPDQAPLFDCNTPAVRDPRITKGMKRIPARQPAGVPACEKGSGCC